MMDATKYPTLQRAGLTQNYLHSNSTTHQFLFGALAELLDNARDANATKINVFTANDTNCRGGFYINFLDDGKGMDPTEVHDIVKFGKSFKRDCGDEMIGKYGNGLKSGSMRIGNDLILFTKRDGKSSMLMLSRTFHDKEQIESIICPMPAWDTATSEPIYQTGGVERHNQEIDLIGKYSPFKSEGTITKQFDKITSETGTLIVIYNMKLLDSGRPELDITTDRTDIRMAEIDLEDQSNLPERVSFKAYAAILYLNPRMKIYVQNKKIRTKRLTSTLCNPMMYKFTSNRFKKRSEDEFAKAEQEYNIAHERAREAESVSRDLELKINNGTRVKKEEHITLRKAQQKSESARLQANACKEIVEQKRKGMKDRKTLDFVFGFNIENRKLFGMFIYNCSRLIRMYERVGPQLNGSEYLSDGESQCAGIVGVVNVPYIVLEPTHNKQNFADNKEYRHMLKAMGDHMQCYGRDVKEVVLKGGIKKFWENYGYTSNDWNSPPSSEPMYKRARAMKVPTAIQCDSCLKWRTLPFQAHLVGQEPPDNWICSMNPDRSHNSCSSAEAVQKFQQGVYRKEVKSKEQAEVGKSPNDWKRVAAMSDRRSNRVKKPKKSFDFVSGSDEDEEDRGGIFSKYSHAEPGAEMRYSKNQNGKRLSRRHKLNSSSSYANERSSGRIRKRHRLSYDSSNDDNSDDYERISLKRSKKKDAKPKEEDVVIGKQLEVDIEGKWRLARIIQTDRDENGSVTKYLVKFSKYPQDRFDREILVKDTSIYRFIDEKMSNGSKPSFSGSTSNGNSTSQSESDVLSKLKTCLRYFLPPNWRISKEEIQNLTTEDLDDFPMEEFFDQYEKGLRCLVSNFKAQASEQGNGSVAQLKKELQDAQQIIHDLLVKFDKKTPQMTFQEVVLYARNYLRNPKEETL